eukprot:comp12623_c0_seq1/m.7663 comp12623_c0_seq1/g.7663  ORF comp12623_c0_seq1/g.7663 comp12623_c0_seq1/m.7663 type:complete len:213 (+) comp12623_c0_seq1:106-744(+)
MGVDASNTEEVLRRQTEALRAFQALREAGWVPVKKRGARGVGSQAGGNKQAVGNQGETQEGDVYLRNNYYGVLADDQWGYNYNPPTPGREYRSPSPDRDADRSRSPRPRRRSPSRRSRSPERVRVRERERGGERMSAARSAGVCTSVLARATALPSATALQNGSLLAHAPVTIHHGVGTVQHHLTVGVTTGVVGQAGAAVAFWFPGHACRGA